MFSSVRESGSYFPEFLVHERELNVAHILAQVHVHFAFISRSFATLRKVQNSTMVEIQFSKIIIVLWKYS